MTHIVMCYNEYTVLKSPIQFVGKVPILSENRKKGPNRL